MRVIVLRPLKLGDFLTGIPAYRAIRRAFPTARITLAAPRELQPLADLLPETIDELVHVRGVEPLPHELHGADIGIDLHGKGPESHRQLLDAGVQRLIAFRNARIPESRDGPPHDEHEHEVARWCRMLKHYAIPADPHELDLPEPAVRLAAHVAGATIIHHGASSEARCWPLERWITVARAERERGGRVILTGSAGEAERAHTIARGAGIPPANVYAGSTGLAELAAMVAAAARVVCGDTGIAHLATAYRRPSVVLFGPTPPSEWGPPQRPIHRVIWNGTTGNAHDDCIDPGLAAITAERVIAELATLSNGYVLERPIVDVPSESRCT